MWRDTDKLSPGEDWRLEIRRAITSGSFVFLACFSKNSAARKSTYQYEELTLAVEEVRKHPLGSTWLIPIRFSECDLPEYDLGGGRDLNSLQRIDLFGEEQELDQNFGRLVAAVNRTLSATDATLGASPIVIRCTCRQIAKIINRDGNGIFPRTRRQLWSFRSGGHVHCHARPFRPGDRWALFADVTARFRRRSDRRVRAQGRSPVRVGSPCVCTRRSTVRTAGGSASRPNDPTSAEGGSCVTWG